MSNIKVGIKIRSHSERENKLKKEVQWLVTDENKIRSVNDLHCYKFDHIFGPECLNGVVYSTIVDPTVKMCMKGCNGTILTYGQTSSGKNETIVGTDKDPGILLLAIKQLFKIKDNSTDATFKISVSYIEIYREKIYDLLNDHKWVVADSNGKLKSKENLLDKVEEAAEILNNGSKKRQRSTVDNKRCSSKSHAIFCIIIESKNKSNGKLAKNYLNFVHVAGCEPVPYIQTLDSLKQANDDHKSLLWLHFVINELSRGKQDIKFGSSTLTKLLRGSLEGYHHTAIICNIKLDAVDETIFTLKFAQQAKLLRHTSALFNESASNSQSRLSELCLPNIANGEVEKKRNIATDTDSNNPCKRAKTERSSTPSSIQMECQSSSDDSEISHLDRQLKEMVEVKVQNSFLRKELEETKEVLKQRYEWYSKTIKDSEFALEKSEHQRIEEKRKSINTKIELEGKVKKFEDEQKKYRDLDKKSSNLEKENVQLKQECKELREKLNSLSPLVNEFANLVNNIPKNELRSKNLKNESSVRTADSSNSDYKEILHSMNLPANLIGCIIGKDRNITKSIESDTRTKLTISRRNGDINRSITITGTIHAVKEAEHLINQMIQNEQSRRQSRFGNYEQSPSVNRYS